MLIFSQKKENSTLTSLSNEIEVLDISQQTTIKGGAISQRDGVIELIYP